MASIEGLIFKKLPCRWGLVPSFTKKGEKPDHYRMVMRCFHDFQACQCRYGMAFRFGRCLQFNARSETVAEKGVFKRLCSRRRCIVLFNGFYEWAKARFSSPQNAFGILCEISSAQICNLRYLTCLAPQDNQGSSNAAQNFNHQLLPLHESIG